MTEDLPISPDEEAALVRRMSELLHVHLPDARSRAAVLIGAGIAMLASEHGQEGLRFAAYVSLNAIDEAARALGLHPTQTPADALAMAAVKFVDQLGLEHGGATARETLEAALADLAEQEAESRH